METNFQVAKNHIEHVFAKEDKKKEPVMFLPPVIAAAALGAEIKQIGVTTTYSEENVPIFSYQVTWTENQATTKSKKKAATTTKKKEPMLKKFEGVKKSKSDSSEEMSLPKLTKKPSAVQTATGKIRCDGPCGRVVPDVSTMQFGCDHIICEKCRNTAKSVVLFDGSPGCCADECVRLAKENGDKMRAGPAVSASPSILSQIGIIEVVPVHVCILKNGGSDVLRTQLDYEFSSTSRLSSLVEALYPYKDLLDQSRFYYSVNKPKTRADLQMISLTETNLRFYDILDANNTKLFFIVIGKGINLT